MGKTEFEYGGGRSYKAWRHVVGIADLEALAGKAVMTPNFGELAEQISKTLGVLDSPDAKKAVIAAALKDAYFQGMADSHREAQDKSSLHEADRTLRRL
jgi:hypothetical protein